MKTAALALVVLALAPLSVSAAGQCWEESGCRRITGIGLGAVRSDDERPASVKHIAAIRAAKLDALRSLAEQVRGVRIKSQTQSTLSELTNDRVFSQTDAVLKGVRFVKVEPVESGIYQATAEIDIQE